MVLNFFNPSQLPLKLARCIQIQTRLPIPIELSTQNKSHLPACTAAAPHSLRQGQITRTICKAGNEIANQCTLYTQQPK